MAIVRCEGCPAVPSGHKCDLLGAIMAKEAFGIVGLKRLEFTCPVILDDRSGWTAVDVVVTSKGATYGGSPEDDSTPIEENYGW